MVKKYTAYIQQQDCFFGGATVVETILFAAMAKLPGSTAADVAEKKAKAGGSRSSVRRQDCTYASVCKRKVTSLNSFRMFDSHNFFGYFIFSLTVMRPAYPVANFSG